MEDNSWLGYRHRGRAACGNRRGQPARIVTVAALFLSEGEQTAQACEILVNNSCRRPEGDGEPGSLDRHHTISDQSVHRARFAEIGKRVISAYSCGGVGADG